MTLNKIRLRDNLLRDIKTGFTYGKQSASQPADPPSPAPQSTGPDDIRSGSIGGAHFYQVRNVIQIPFDDSIDGTYFLECFFQMPSNVKKISKAQVWVQKKPFRTYTSTAAATSAGGSLGTTNNSSGHTHTQTSAINTGGGATPTTDAQGVHTHLDGDGVTTTGASVSHSHNVNSHTHSYNDGSAQSTANESVFHTHTLDTTHSHSITLTSGIFESGGTGNLTLYVSDDGNSAHYGASIVGPTASDIAAQDITSQLTSAAGDKRIKITASAIMRVQVLLVLDLLVAVDPIAIGIP